MYPNALTLKAHIERWTAFSNFEIAIMFSYFYILMEFLTFILLLWKWINSFRGKITKQIGIKYSLYWRNSLSTRISNQWTICSTVHKGKTTSGVGQCENLSCKLTYSKEKIPIPALWSSPFHCNLYVLSNKHNKYQQTRSTAVFLSYAS